jgi:hypothetical protein
VSEAVTHPISRIANNVNRKSPLKFVVLSSVQEIADANHTRRSPPKNTNCPAVPLSHSAFAMESISLSAIA